MKFLSITFLGRHFALEAFKFLKIDLESFFPINILGNFRIVEKNPPLKPNLLGVDLEYPHKCEKSFPVKRFKSILLRSIAQLDLEQLSLAQLSSLAWLSSALSLN